MNHFHETPEQQRLRSSVAEMAGRYGLEYFAGKAKSGEDTTEVWEEAARAGFLGVSIPEKYGGAGAGIYELQLVAEEFAAGGVPLLFLPVSTAMCATFIAKAGTEEQKKRWLAGFADGSARMTFGVSDPAGGSNLHRIAATARRDGDDWVLSGHKSLVSAIDLCDAMMVIARTEDAATGKLRPALFIVDRDAPGLSYEKTPMVFTAATGQFEVTMDEVRLPGSALVGENGSALRALFAGALNPERITFAAWSCGLGRYAIDRAVRYARERRVWNTTIGAHQGLSHPLAMAKINLELARTFVQKAAWLYDHGQDVSGEVANMAKYAAGEAAIRAVDQAVQIHGGYGLTEEHLVGILYPMVRVAHLAPVSREMLLNFVAEHTLGLEKSY
ncbi:acyl-CoA dehydrogenase family protein [Streptomyces sp. NPDC057271]|uniref:acyl-CoA dehydrogenase family protein n=1 Tax=unclassified Streptomyces TaxID=2593676 RepID=UPI0036323951